MDELLNLQHKEVIPNAVEMWVEKGLGRFGRADGPDFAPSEIEDALLV